MTLKEKFKKEGFSNCEYLEQVADEFAIGFTEWVQNNCDEFPKEDQKLILKTYKKEKGL